MSLHYYSSWSSVYPAPWRYHSSDKKARFDFTMFDHNLQILLDEETLRKQFTERGVAYWGVYNRIIIGWIPV